MAYVNNNSKSQFTFKQKAIFVIVFLIMAGMDKCIEHYKDNKPEFQTVNTTKTEGKNSFDINGNPIKPELNKRNVNPVDTTSPEYIVSNLSGKKNLSKLERKKLKDAKENIAIMESERIAEARFAEVKNLKANFEKKCLSGWDGSCPGLVAYVKDRMNDPSSFEHVETRYFIQGDYVVLVMQYRGKNAFNATVTNFIKAKVNSNCEVLKILEAQ